MAGEGTAFRCLPQQCATPSTPGISQGTRFSSPSASAARPVARDSPHGHRVRSAIVAECAVGSAQSARRMPRGNCRRRSWSGTRGGGIAASLQAARSRQRRRMSAREVILSEAPTSSVAMVACPGWGRRVERARSHPRAPRSPEHTSRESAPNGMQAGGLRSGWERRADDSAHGATWSATPLMLPAQFARRYFDELRPLNVARDWRLSELDPSRRLTIVAQKVQSGAKETRQDGPTSIGPGRRQPSAAVCG